MHSRMTARSVLVKWIRQVLLGPPYHRSNHERQRLEDRMMPDQKRIKLLNELCKTCSRHRVIPTSMRIPDCSEGSEEVECGGFANISQGTYEGRLVAIKVVCMYITSDLDAIYGVSLLFTAHTRMNEYLPEILSRGSRVEAPPAPKHLTTPWSDSRRTPVCDGFRVDEKRKHQRVHRKGVARKPC